MSLADLIASRSSSTPLEEPSVPVGPSEAVIPSTIADEGSSSGDTLTSRSSGDVDESASGDAASAPAGESTPPAADSEPYGVSEQEHPSGICVYFQAGPKRLYKLRGRADTPSGVQYTDWKEVFSVSTVLDVLEKGGLPWWGMKVGIAGVQELVERGTLSYELGSWWTNPALVPVRSATVEDIVALLTKHKLTVNHVRDQAGDRGKNVHTALELWAEKGILPQVEVYAPEEQGYVQGLLEFLIDSGAEAAASEVMVGSLKHKFAGRYDLEAQIPNDAEVVMRVFPKKEPIRARVPGGLYLLDLKTSKEVYDTHFIQLEAYETGRIECGLEPTKYRGVIHVTADGRYELKLNIQHHGNVPGPTKYMPRFDDGKPLVTFTDFKHVLAVKKSLDRIKARK